MRKPPLNKPPEQERYLSVSNAFKYLQQRYPDITREEYNIAIEIKLISIQEKTYEYNRGEYIFSPKTGKKLKRRTFQPRIIKQVDRKVCLGDVIKWADTKSEI